MKLEENQKDLNLMCWLTQVKCRKEFQHKSDLTQQMLSLLNKSGRAKGSAHLMSRKTKQMEYYWMISANQGEGKIRGKSSLLNRTRADLPGPALAKATRRVRVVMATVASLR